MIWLVLLALVVAGLAGAWATSRLCERRRRRRVLRGLQEIVSLPPRKRKA